MKFRFIRHEVFWDKKKYIVLIPEVHERLWIVDWANDWYEGCFIDGSAKCLMNLIAGFGVLAFHPNVIIYLPVRNKEIPNDLNRGDNGTYDMVFCTNRCQLRLSEWKQIRAKLNGNRSIYRFDMDTNRIKQYFNKELNKYPSYWGSNWLNKAGANMELRSCTAFFVFPNTFYAENAIDLYEYFNSEFEKDDFSYCYNEEKDNWTCSTVLNVIYGGVKRHKLTYEHPFVTFYLELYDVDIINRYKKEKVFFEHNHNQAVQPTKEGYRALKIKFSK